MVVTFLILISFVILYKWRCVSSKDFLPLLPFWNEWMIDFGILFKMMILFLH